MSSPVESGSERLRRSESLVLEHGQVSLRDGATPDTKQCYGCGKMFVRRKYGARLTVACEACIRTKLREPLVPYDTVDGRAEIEHLLSPDERWYARHHGDFE